MSRLCGGIAAVQLGLHLLGYEEYLELLEVCPRGGSPGVMPGRRRVWSLLDLHADRRKQT